MGTVPDDQRWGWAGEPSPWGPPIPDHIDGIALLQRRRVRRAERAAEGRDLRRRLPLADLAALPDRANRSAVTLLLNQEPTRDPDVIALRYQRMSHSPVAFVRGAAAVQACDFFHNPHSGISVQLNGDAHASNFALFRDGGRAVFDFVDFDETLPGPFEYDVKRLATSLVTIARSIGCDDVLAHGIAVAAAGAYRATMAQLAESDVLDVWQGQHDVEAEALAHAGLWYQAPPDTEPEPVSATRATADRDDLLEPHGNRFRFRSQNPMLVPQRAEAQVELQQALTDEFTQYLQVLDEAQLGLLLRYRLTDVALRTLGNGDLARRAVVLLLQTRASEPVVLQLQQAVPPSLETHLGAGNRPQSGARVVGGQRVLQVVRDPLLGVWPAPGLRHTWYARTIAPRAGYVDATTLGADDLLVFARLTGATIARAHARVGNSALVAGYLGVKDTFDRAIADFALGYATIMTLDRDDLADYRDGTIRRATAARTVLHRGGPDTFPPRRPA